MDNKANTVLASTSDSSEPRTPKALNGQNIHRPPQIELFSDQAHIPSGYAHGLELVTVIPWFEPDKRNLTIRGAAEPSDLRQTRLCTISGQKIELEVTAATLSDCYRFPGGREELVLDALLKIASEGNNGVFIEDSSAVAFSLSKVHRTLKEHNDNKTKFNLTEIKESLLVLNRAPFDVRIFGADGDCETYEDTLISGLGVLSRKDWLTCSDKDVTCYARFHPMVTQAIKKMRVRPYSLTHNVQFRSPAARRLHKHLSMIYKQASIAHPFTIGLSTALGLVGYQNKDTAKIYSTARPIEKGLQELVDKKIIERFEFYSKFETGARGRKAESDRIYTLYPHEEFCSATRRSNAIQSQMKAKLSLIQLFKDEEITSVETMSDFETARIDRKINQRVLAMDGNQAKKVLQRRLDEVEGSGNDVVSEEV